EFRARYGPGFRTVLRENLRRIHLERGIPWRTIMSNGEIQGIFLFLQEPYEWRAAQSYARETGAVLEDVDLSRYSQERLSAVPELISNENLLTLLASPSPPLREQVENQYRRASLLFLHPPAFVPGAGEEGREEHLAVRIRAMEKEAAAARGKYVHIGGWEHLLESHDGSSLFGILRDLRPRRVLVGEGKESASIYCGRAQRGAEAYSQNLWKRCGQVQGWEF
ncbi:MAG TPA: hypothetical protein VLS90_06895, partial [Thermodesulfobacteriota bacterium]|nr:hypothetical protein [Thermodesulfobacteriota bacterium]